MVGLDADHIITQHAENGVATDTIMKNFNYTDFEVQTFLMASSASFTELGSLDYNTSVEKAGFYPIGIVGYRSQKAGIITSSVNIQNRAVGSCTLQFRWDNTTSSAQTSNLYAIILWVRV